jgi:hypothetical protein
VYNKKEYIGRILKSYKEKSVKHTPQSVELKHYIRALNRAHTRKGDFVQSKIGFKEKVEKFVNVPETILYTKNLDDIDECVRRLSEFVFKPNHLSRGIGIRVLNRVGNRLVDMNGDRLAINDLIDEASALMKVRRGKKNIRGILFEKRIFPNESTKHPEYDGDGITDVRIMYLYDKFLFSVVRFPSTESNGYGNIIRGAKWGAIMDTSGEFVVDTRIQRTDVVDGFFPFFDELVTTGKMVTKMYELPFQSVDMTVDESGNIIVIETERLPQIEYYLTQEGIKWMWSRFE